MKKKRILFVAEAATLAHVARPLLLSAALDPTRFDICFACDPRCQWLLRDFPGRYYPLSSMGSGPALAVLVTKILGGTEHAAAARKIAASIAGYDSGSRFAALITSVTSRPAGALATPSPHPPH